MSSAESLPACCRCCCYPCIMCCCPPDQPKDKYGHVQYKAPMDAKITPGTSVGEEFHKVPVEKMFMFHQPRTDYSIHPQITSSDTEESSSGIVSDQPRQTRTESVYTSEHSPHGSLLSLPHSSAGDSAVAGSDSSYPTLQYSLYYDIQRNSLTVNLGQAFNLPTKAKSGSADTSVVLYMQPNKAEVFESKVVRKDLNPIFDQTFEFTGLLGVQVARKQTLILKVYGRSRFGQRELIGRVAVQLEHADLFGLTVHSRIEEHSSGMEFQTYGDILFSLTYKPDVHMINGIVLKATGLQKQDITGAADPYVKVNLFHRGKRVAKWRSPVKKHTLVPVFNEPFQFDIYSLETTELSMDIIVMDYDRFSHDQVVGIVRLGSKVADEMGKTHWDEMIATPNSAISRWHSIVPMTAEESSATRSRIKS